VTKPTGIWATESWYPRIPRGLFFVILGPIAAGYAALQVLKLKAFTCVRDTEMSGDLVFEPKLVSVAVYFLAVFLALGRAHDVGQELSLLRYFRQRGVVLGGSDAMFVSTIFGLGFAFALPILLYGAWSAFRCREVADVFASIWGLSFSSLFAVLFLILPLLFLSRPSGPDPRQPPSEVTP